MSSKNLDLFEPTGPTPEGPAPFRHGRYAAPGGPSYEVSSWGDKRFSALNARLSDNRTIEEAYQLDVKGYRRFSNDWRAGKGKPPLGTGVKDLWAEYLALWRQWSIENPALMDELAKLARGKVLTDRFASSPISQARALAELLNERELGQRDQAAPSAAGFRKRP